MAKILALCLDDGHGQETPGKRSPITGMRENTFNRAVVNYMKQLCDANGILYKEVAPGDTDVPLETRAKTANDWYAGLKKQYGNNLICWYLSVHANAGGGYGTEVWVHSTAIKEIQDVANKVCSAVSALTGKNRGVKKGYPGDSSGNFYVNRATDMYSMLIEHAFMDTQKDSALLMQETFRKNCAAASLKAICGYYGIPFDENKGQGGEGGGESPQPPSTDKLYRVRKTWNDAASQKGAFANLDGAKKCADQYKLTVFDWNGKAVYPNGSAFQVYEVVITADVLNIRSGPGTNYKVNGTVKKNWRYHIIDEATGQGAKKWGKLKSSAGWISLDWTQKVK